MPMTVLLTPEQESTLKSISEEIVTTGPFEVWYIPHAFKSMGDGLYERYDINDIPGTIKDKFLLKKSAI